tara:strand:+ start:39 stop:557 length:519 start_codon:yes stop_codon:yes gene_type:complete
MRNTKVKKGNIKVPYFLIETDLENIDCNFFIEKIEQGILEKENKSFVTNVKGQMTSWTYFNNNLKFMELCLPILDYLEDDFNLEGCSLKESWGIKSTFGHYTCLHNHANCYFSGVIYLNNHDSTIDFPDLKKQIPIKKNKLVLFSGNLKHKTKRHLSKKPKYAISFNFYKNK